jgi:hypothetical protein
MLWFSPSTSTDGEFQESIINNGSQAEILFLLAFEKMGYDKK